MGHLRGRAAAAAGAVVAAAGSAAWALASTSMAAVQAAEARALGPGHTAEMPGEDELALVAHDARLAGLVVVACGLAVARYALPRRVATAAWLGGATALVVANATLGRAVDDGSVVLVATELLLVTGAAAVVASLLGLRPRASTPSSARGRLSLLAAGAAAAGTLPVLSAQGLASERYAAWVPAGLAASNLVSALALAGVLAVVGVLLARSAVGAASSLLLPAAALALLLEPQGSSWQVGDSPRAAAVALVVAAAPLVRAAARERDGSPRRTAAAVAVLLGSGALLALVPQLLAITVLVGGGLGMAVTAPAGAYISYDGLPIVGGGLVLGAAVLALCAALRSPSLAPPERSEVVVEAR